MKNYNLLIVCLVAIGFTTVSCGKKDENSLEAKQARIVELQKEADKINAEIATLQQEVGVAGGVEELKISNVKAMPIASENFSHFVEASGRLDAVNNVWISPQSGGALTSVLVKEGDYVTKGQKIATIDNSVMRNTISEIQIQMEMAKTLFERQKALWDQKIGTEIQYIQAKSQVESLEKRLTTLKSQDAMNVVLSPLSGMIDEVRLKSGEIASPGMGIVRVVNSSNLKVVAKIPDTYAGTIQKGDVVKIKFPDLKKEVTSRLSFVSQTIDPISRTFTAEASVPIDKQLKPNMTAILNINDQSRPAAIVVPRNLIQHTELGDIVYVAVSEGKNQIARAKAVTTGLSYDGNIEITSGLTAGEILIIDGYQDLVDGQLVNY